MAIIRLKDENVLKVEIHDSDDKPTGEYLVFDLEDIELPLKYQQILEEDKKNRNWIKSQLIIIDKRQDVKGKKLLSKNEEDKIKALNEYYEREMKTIDLFIGDGGCRKLLNGRKPYYEMFDDIDEMLQPVLQELQISMTSIEDKIKSKYKDKVEDSNVLQ